jgi:type 1 glutamine amidotransferase
MRFPLFALSALLSISAFSAEPNAPVPPPADSPLSAPVPKPPADAKHPRVLLVGGGSSHNFAKFFGETDKAILASTVGWVDFTQNANGVSDVLADVDLLVWSANQPIASSTSKALMDWVNAGKPLVLLHPGVWYNWRNFPEWNQQIVGGGARGHDKYGEFEVKVVNTTHPIMKGVPASFKVSDELYHTEIDSAGTPVEVLAETEASPTTGKTYPSVWVVKHPTARIAAIALGHDAKVHDDEAFRTILRNAVSWASGK